MSASNGTVRTSRGALRRRSVVIGAAAAGVLVASGLAVVAGRTAEASPAAGDAGSWGAQHQVRDVSANLFEWNWPSVATECTKVLGPAGYGSVQVSPPADSLKRQTLGDGSDTVLHPWWEVYQPADYRLNGRMGTEAQFRAMVATCRKAGVKVIVDAVINHMTGQGSSPTAASPSASTATRACTAPRTSTATRPTARSRPPEDRLARAHRRLQRLPAGLQLRARRALRPTHAVDQGPPAARRLPEQAHRLRRLRLPRRRRQAHRPDRPGGHRGAAAPHRRRHPAVRRARGRSPAARAGCRRGPSSPSGRCSASTTPTRSRRRSRATTTRRTTGTSAT